MIRPLATTACLALSVAACGGAPALSRGSDGSPIGTGGGAAVAVDAPPPQADITDVAVQLDPQPLVVSRDERLGELDTYARVQLARGSDATWAVLASDGRNAATLHWVAPGATKFNVARGQEGTLLGGELALLQRANREGSTQAAVETDRLRPLGAAGWGAPRPLTREAAEAALTAGSPVPASQRSAFAVGSGEARHAFTWGVNRLEWTHGGERRTLCACDGVFRALLDPTDGAPTLLVSEGGGAFVLRFSDGRWSRFALIPRATAPPESQICHVGFASDDQQKLPPACSVVSQRLLALDGADFAGQTRAVWVSLRSEGQWQCVRSNRPCDPSGPSHSCSSSIEWSCSEVRLKTTTSVMQGTIAGGALRVAPLDGVAAPNAEHVSIALRADADAAHLAVASALTNRMSTIRHLELRAKGSPQLAARPVLEAPAPAGAVTSEDQLLALGFSGFGEGIFDGGTLELRKNAYRGIAISKSSFRFEVVARFSSAAGHGIEVSGRGGTVELNVDAASASLQERIPRTEPVGPLERIYALQSRALDASTAHRYSIAVKGNEVAVSIDGQSLGIANIEGGVSSLRFGCLQSCDAPSVTSVWSSLSRP